MISFLVYHLQKFLSHQSLNDFGQDDFPVLLQQFSVGVVAQETYRLVDLWATTSSHKTCTNAGEAPCQKHLRYWRLCWDFRMICLSTQSRGGSLFCLVHFMHVVHVVGTHFLIFAFGHTPTYNESNNFNALNPIHVQAYYYYNHWHCLQHLQFIKSVKQPTWKSFQWVFPQISAMKQD